MRLGGVTSHTKSGCLRLLFGLTEAKFCDKNKKMIFLHLLVLFIIHLKYSNFIFMTGYFNCICMQKSIRGTYEK